LPAANHWMPQEIQHAARHRAVEEPQRLTDDERLIVKRNLGFFVTADVRSPRTTSCSARIATSPRPSAGSTCCGRRSKRPSTRTRTSTSREPRPQRVGDLQRVSRDQIDHGQGRTSSSRLSARRP
jgi:hypothetical protein